MSPRVSKSKNLDKYPYFLRYDRPNDIPFKKIANKLGTHPNLLRGMMRSARSNSTIYTALIKKGYKDHQIPGWFARQDEPPVYRRAAAAGSHVSAEKRSGAEAHSNPITGDTSPIRDVVQEGSAERPSALSVRSAPPASEYILVQPEYRPLLDPIVEEAFRQIREIQDDELRASLNRTKRRRDPPRPVSPDVIRARIEAFTIMKQIEARNAALMFMMNLVIADRASERLVLEEIKDAFTKPFKEMALKKESANEEGKDTIEAVCTLLKVLIPDPKPSDDFMRRYKAAVEKKEERDRKAWVDFGMLVAGNRKRKNFELEIIEHQGRQLIENFYKDARAQPIPLDAFHSETSRSGHEETP
jgi:hypothetical protein